MWSAGIGRTALVAYITSNILEIVIKNIYINAEVRNVCALEKRTLVQVSLKILTARSLCTQLSSLIRN